MLKRAIILSAAMSLTACGGGSDSSEEPAATVVNETPATIETPTTGEPPASSGSDPEVSEEPVATTEAESVPQLVDGSESIMPPGVPKLDI